MAYRVFLEDRAAKQIAKFDAAVRSRVEALRELEKGFSARLDIKKLKGTKYHYRIRVGDYRILFMLESNKALVYDVSHRQSVYD
ncbi:type II toxin-antitoxin system RelE/ParE family toxin [Nitrososphaera sp.]|uniref:type II toxin-antitoxin system RelE family toxin n=1 Tax=Nitrososphaera sp. TaxID=1971748 RepID=UPI00183E8FDF|nr:type II toxin-antitoxin system RelE/ParE family toxin [Nitrososphaera sp.]NWG38231.1 type II toxin-antitoxin system RelE/ParE family toxin [Nitrososphaera sp.]